MNQYDIYLPLCYNDGRNIEPEKFDLTRQELTARFRGITVLNPEMHALGTWVSGGSTFRDYIRIFRVVTTQHDEEFWQAYKSTLKDRFRQHELLIVRLPASLI